MSNTRSQTIKMTIPKKNRMQEVLFEYHPEGKANSSKGVITFTEHDRQQLKAPRFLNDTIISFFIQYHLDNVVKEEFKQKVHVVNSFFFSKLSTIKTKSDQIDLTFKCASRWLKGVEIFSKDFLIIPVCDHDHWSLVVVCYAHRLHSQLQNLIPDHELYEPAVIVLNSWFGNAPSVKKTLGKFLKFQWQIEKQGIRSFKISSKPQGIRLISPRLPQQKNNYNCGVYLLNFLYCFLNNPRKAYIRMYRGRDLSGWFEENGINIASERRRMKEIVKSQTKLSKLDRDTNHDVPEEILIESPPDSQDEKAVQIDNNEQIIVIH